MNRRNSIRHYRECFNVDNNSSYCSTPNPYCKKSNYLFSDGYEKKRFFDDNYCSVACCTEYSESVEALINKYICKENLIENNDREKTVKEMHRYNSQQIMNSEMVENSPILSKNTGITTDKLQNRLKYMTKSITHLSSEGFNNDREYLTDNRKFGRSNYCRPIVNNKVFVPNTFKTNQKVHDLVCKLMQEMQKERQKRDWKKFISFLKNKHRCNSEFPQVGHAYVNTNCNKDSYNHLVFNDLSNLIKCQTKETLKCDNKETNLMEAKNIYESKLICYPTSSQGRRKKILQKERDNFKKVPYTVYTSVGRNTVHEETIKHDNINKDLIYIKNTLASQTDSNVLLKEKEKNNAINTTKHTLIEEFLPIKNKLKSEKTNTQDAEIIKANPLTSIETKIDTLLQSINLFIDQIKENNIRNIEKHLFIPNELRNNKKSTVNDVKSESYNIAKKCNLDINKNRSHFTVQPRPIPQIDCKIVKTNKILTENIIHNASEQEISATNKIMSQRNSSLVSSFKKPTIEKATEVTASFHKPKLKASQIINTEETSSTLNIERKTQAANTEPLSVLALLRVSTETLRQLLSYMPTIDYYSYLSQLQFPYSNVKTEPKYVCNICGGAFNKASLLNDHIKGHEIGVTRDCDVCRHVLEAQSCRHCDDFKCQYCGQRFTRAYCCELHQQSCAKRFGLRHDVSSSLIILR